MDPNGSTPGAPLRILVIEDSPDDAELMQRALRRERVDFVAERVETEPELATFLARGAPHVVLCDYHMPALSCERAFELLRRLDAPPPVIVVSRHIDADEAAEVIRMGARAIVRKSRLGELAAAVCSVVGGPSA